MTFYFLFLVAFKLGIVLSFYNLFVLLGLEALLSLLDIEDVVENEKMLFLLPLVLIYAHSPLGDVLELCHELNKELPIILIGNGVDSFA